MRHDAVRHDGLPLSEPVLLILLSVADQPRHGYAILKDVEELSDGRVRLSTGTLYGAIRRMLDAGWIRRVAETDAPRDRTAYSLTPAGSAVLTAEVGRMKALVRAAGRRIVREQAV